MNLWDMDSSTYWLHLVLVLRFIWHISRCQLHKHMYSNVIQCTWVCVSVCLSIKILHFNSLCSITWFVKSFIWIEPNTPIDSGSYVLSAAVYLMLVPILRTHTHTAHQCLCVCLYIQLCACKYLLIVYTRMYAFV